MKKIKTIFFFGILLIALPFLGFPSQWKSVGVVSVGFLLLVVSYLWYRELLGGKQPGGTAAADTFIDNGEVRRGPRG